MSMEELNLSIEELITIIEIGHEIEFHLYEKKYFLQPDYDYNEAHEEELGFEPWVVIYDCTNQNDVFELFKGTCSDIIECQFVPGICLKNNIDIFVFDFIL